MTLPLTFPIAARPSNATSPTPHPRPPIPDFQQCSAAMTQGGGFVGVVQSAAATAGRTITLLKTVGPAADHVTNPCYPEGAYLTGAFFYVV